MAKLIDLTGNRYGDLVVTGYAGPRGKSRRAQFWNVLCNCGTSKAISGPHLKRGDAKSCGCRPRKKAVYADTVARFWTNVDKRGPTPTHVPHLGPCWIFGKGAPNRYGRISTETGRVHAHRFSYELRHGPGAADGMFVCHHCDNPVCVRPDHLFLGTPLDNTQDMIRKGRDDLKRDGVGSRNNNVKLTEDQVREIRAASARGVSRNTLARQYGVSKPMIKNIALRRNWKHLV